MSCNRCEQAGVGSQRSPQGSGDDRGRNRPAPGARQGSRAEKLSQAVRGEEVDGDDADAPGANRAEDPGCQQPPGGDAHVVGGNQDGDRRQWIVALGGGNGGPEGLSRRPAVADPRDFGAQNKPRSWLTRPNICNESNQ